MDKAFHSKVLVKLPEIFDRCSRALVERLEREGRVGRGREEGFDFHPYANQCAIHMLLEGALGFRAEEGEILDVKEAVKKYNRSCNMRIIETVVSVNHH